MTIGQLVRISPTFGSKHPDDLAARGQMAEVIDDLYARTQSALFKNLYEVRLLSGPAAGETRLVTISELEEA